MLEKNTSLYDMTDIIDCGGDPSPTVPTQESPERSEEADEEETEKDAGWIWIGVLGLCGCAMAAVLLNRKKLLAFFSKE
jgi:hypothetical protein